MSDECPLCGGDAFDGDELCEACRDDDVRVP
jgi:hypothetical protein